MVIPGNPPSQLRVLHSSQQLYVSLYLASCCSSTNTLFLKTLKENSFLSSHNVVLPPLNSAILPLLFLLFFFGFAFPTISAAATFSPAATFSSVATFFVQSFYSHLTACGTPLQKVPPRVKVLLQLQKSEVDSLWPLRM